MHRLNTIPTGWWDISDKVSRHYVYVNDLKTLVHRFKLAEKKHSQIWLGSSHWMNKMVPYKTTAIDKTCFFLIFFFNNYTFKKNILDWNWIFVPHGMQSKPLTLVGAYSRLTACHDAIDLYVSLFQSLPWNFNFWLSSIHW